jgi:hypothetical protein
MNNENEYQMKGNAMIGAGIFVALFWILAIPFEAFAGVDVPQHPLFVPGQVFHILGAILAVFGYFGIYLFQRKESGKLGSYGFAIAVIGMMFFLADAMIGIVVFPELAQHAPALTEATGPLFTGRALGFYILFAATNMIGIVVLAISMLRAKRLPSRATYLFLVGGVLFNLPPIPAIHLVLVAGGVIWGIGAVLLGQAMKS